MLWMTYLGANRTSIRDPAVSGPAFGDVTVRPFDGKPAGIADTMKTRFTLREQYRDLNGSASSLTRFARLTANVAPASALRSRVNKKLRVPPNA